MRRGPSGFLVSILFHVCACILLYLGLHQAHTVDSRPYNQRYAVRIMELRKQEPKLHPPIEKVILDPGQPTDAQPMAHGAAPATAAALRIPENLITQKRAPQTLIQPEAPPDVTIAQTMLPQVFVWNAPQQTVKKIVQPAPQTVPQVNVRPSLDSPNQEVHVSDLKLSSTEFDAKVPLPNPSKTSPVSAPNAQKIQQIPQTASKDTGPATPASVISLSNVQLQEGTAALPMVNEVAATPFTGSLTPGQPKSLSQTGSGKVNAKENGAGAGQVAGNEAGKSSGAVGGSAGQNGANGQSGANASVLPGDGQRTIVHLTRPQDGKFGVVVVGSSLAEDYPETVNLWSGRLAYTVYLHVGVSRNWILQYSIPRAQTAASAGNVARPDAPWPYDIARPSIDADANTDAIMVHGFVNTAGRFDQLAIIFPTELAEAKFLLRALQQWQFRPAMQNGQATEVEVLIIIPAETE
ncbi:MAG TPA: hypothetical protein VHW70_04500 [Edaphobacter sp.]|nr:hypothetical protein [Edaphobacter sp.]